MSKLLTSLKTKSIGLSRAPLLSNTLLYKLITSNTHRHSKCSSAVVKHRLCCRNVPTTIMFSISSYPITESV